MQDRIGNTSSSSEEVLDIRYYVTYLITVWLKYYKLIALTNLIGVIAVVAYVQSLVPNYTATVTLHIAPKDNTVFNLEQLYWGDNDSGFRETQIGILQSNKLLRSVVEQLDLHEVPALSAGAIRVGPIGFFSNFFGRSSGHGEEDIDWRIESAADELSGLITITEADEYDSSNLLYVSVSMAQPQLAADTANTLGESYINSVFLNEIETAIKNQSFLTERLAVLRRELQSSEQALRDYMEEQDIVSTGSDRDEVDGELNAVSARYFEARQERVRLENLLHQVKNLQRGGLELGNVSAVASDPTVARMNSEIIDLDRRRVELSRRYGSRHQKMIAVESELETAKNSLKKQIANVLKGIESDLAVARRTEQGNNTALEEVRDKKQSRGRKDFELTQLQQDIDVKRDVYTAFLEKLNQNSAAGPVRNTNLWVADPATVPRQGSKLSLVTAIIAAMLVCSGLSFGLGTLLVYTDNSLETEADVLDKTGAQLLGMLPLVDGDTDDNTNTLFTEYQQNLHSRFSEAIRSVRTSLTLLKVNGVNKKILVTSCQTSEGKTSVALTLSASFGQTSQVLLIDADLRRPSIERAINESGQKLLGLSDAISGGAEIEDCITRHEIARFDILPAGSRSLRPLELLGSTQFTKLLNDLSDKYDYIIVDSPPCSAVSDAYLLGSMVDIAVFVVKAASTSVTNIRAVLNRFRELEVPIAGVLLNQVDLEARRHPYYDYKPYESYGASDEPVKLNETA